MISSHARSIPEKTEQPSFSYTLRWLWKGQSLLRLYMNYALQSKALSGQVLDVGGLNAHYHGMDTKCVTAYVTIDQKLAKEAGGNIDLEQDTLPFSENHFNMVVMLNVLEHIYHHDHILREARRVMRPDGTLIGFVPFFIRVHPDPRDFFRYTDEALTCMLEDAGFRDIKINTIGGGPFKAQFNIVVQSLPRPLRLVLYPLHAFFDALFLRFRPHATTIYPLGYFFEARK